MAIYVKFAEEKKPKSVKEFLTKFFSSNNYSSHLKNVQTYSGKDLKEVQCRADKYRSFDDVLELVQTYYKSITPKKLFEILLNLKLINGEGECCYLYMMSCSNIYKINLLYVKSRTLPNQCDYDYICGLPIYDSNYSWKELFEMINIRSNNDLTKYLNNEK